MVVPKGYVSVLWRTCPGPNGEPTADSLEDTVLLAPDGYAAPTDSGEHSDRFSGSALVTFPDRPTAIARWMKLGYSRDIAEIKASWNSRSGTPKGKRYAGRLHLARGGPLWLGLDYGPDDAYPGVGALPARKLRAERAEPALTVGKAAELRALATQLHAAGDVMGDLAGPEQGI